MTGYDAFALVYDQLTENVNYAKRAEYFSKVFESFGKSPKTLLDLACGTGSLSIALADLGYNVIATDGSIEMLTVASSKLEDRQNIHLLNQPMEDTDIGTKVDGVICALDSINHLSGIDSLAAVFRRLSLCLNNGGLFIFDVNTAYKHKEVLGENCFVFEKDDFFCTWQNFYNNTDDSVDIQLDFFLADDDEGYSYIREQECFTEIIFTNEELETQLNKAGFKLLDIYGEDGFNQPKEKEERLIFVAQKDK